MRIRVVFLIAGLGVTVFMQTVIRIFCCSLDKVIYYFVLFLSKVTFHLEKEREGKKLDSSF